MYVRVMKHHHGRPKRIAGATDSAGCHSCSCARAFSDCLVVARRCVLALRAPTPCGRIVSPCCLPRIFIMRNCLRSRDQSESSGLRPLCLCVGCMPLLMRVFRGCSNALSSLIIKTLCSAMFLLQVKLLLTSPFEREL